MNAQERETVINASDGDDVIRIWTAQRIYITRLRNHPAVIEVDSGRHDGTEWAEFTIPADQWNPTRGIKRVVKLTVEQRAVQAERLAEYLSRGQGG